MRLLMTALGSYGDVLPIVGLGAAMLGRGHQVTVISNPYFRSNIESAGLDFLPLGVVEDYENLAHHEDLWHPLRGPKLVLRTVIEEAMRLVYDHLETIYQPG